MVTILSRLDMHIKRPDSRNKNVMPESGSGNPASRMHRGIEAPYAGRIRRSRLTIPAPCSRESGRGVGD